MHSIKCFQRVCITANYHLSLFRQILTDAVSEFQFERYHWIEHGRCEVEVQRDVTHDQFDAGIIESNDVENCSDDNRYVHDAIKTDHDTHAKDYSNLFKFFFRIYLFHICMKLLLLLFIIFHPFESSIVCNSYHNDDDEEQKQHQ